MYEGIWTISPCLHRDSSELSRALGVSETTARVLVRRGYGNPEEARAFLEGALPGHDPLLLGEHARGLRDDPASRRRSASASACTATTTPTASAPPRWPSCVLRELGADVTWHLPSRFEEGYGLREETLTKLAADGRGLVLTVDCGITAVEEVAHAKSSWESTSWSPTTTVRARSCPTARSSPRRPSEYPFPELCGTGVVYKLASGAARSRTATCWPRHLDLVALATIADVVPLIDENRALAQAGLRAPGADTEARPAGARCSARASIPRASTKVPSASGLPRGSTPPGRLCRPGSRRSSCCSPRTADVAGRLAARARGAEPRAAAGRGSNSPLGSLQGGGMAGGEATTARLRPRRRGLARRRDRHRRFTPRRALQPACRAHRGHRRGVEGLGPLDRCVRPTRRPGGVRESPRSLRRAPCRRRALDQARERRGVRRRRSPRTPTSTSPTRTCSRSPGSTRSSPAPS